MFCLHYSPLFPVQDLKNVFEAADIDHSTKIGEHQEQFCWQAQLRPQSHYPVVSQHDCNITHLTGTVRAAAATLLLLLRFCCCPLTCRRV
jgi:hypothetical protein